MKTFTPLKLHCSSVFAPYSASYVGQKQAIGIKASGIIEQLNSFDKFCITNKVDEAILTEQLFADWSAKRPYENEHNRIDRVRFLRAFARFLIDNNVTVSCKFHKMPSTKIGFTPYIFTHEELKRFFIAVDKYSTITTISPIRHLVMPLLYRMIYTCGLRINEALLLKRSSVDLEKGTLRILIAKGGIERIVPMSSSLAKMCREYCNNKLLQACNSEYFFPSRDLGWCDASTIYAQFREILMLARISHGGRGKGPRLHDLRHTFAVHAMARWAKMGKDLYVILPILSTYLGHVGLKSTQKYLRLVPEAYADVTNAFEKKHNGMFPEVQL